MKTVKGFVTINAFVSNVPDQVSLLGELSTWSRTYSKEKGEYVRNANQGYKLTTFRVYDTDLNSLTTLQDSEVAQILNVITACVAYSNTHMRPYDPTDFRNEILSQFHGSIGNVQLGDFIDNGSIALPAFISWENLNQQNSPYKIWLSDDAFQNQYDEFEIEIVTPLEPLDNFFQPYNTALTQLNSRSTAALGDLIQDKKGVHPETYLRILNFDFYNEINLAQKNPTTWAVLIYGKQGDTPDTIKDKIVEYILANSGQTRSRWEVILPDLFKRTEFSMLPRWDKISIENLTPNSSLYSSMLNIEECANFAKLAIDHYPDAFVEANINIFPFDYKGIAVVSVNGNTNVAHAADLKQLYPDYLPVPTTSPDFSRMALKTRQWVLMMLDMLMVAETATLTSSVPNTMRKQLKSGVLYISQLRDNVNYLVAAKSNSIYD